MMQDSKTKWNDNDCPYNCPCIEDYPNCYCQELIEEDECMAPNSQAIDDGFKEKIADAILPYGITADEAGEALEKLSEAIRKATTADSIELEKRNIERNPSINFFQKRKLIKQLDDMKGEL